MENKSELKSEIKKAPVIFLDLQTTGAKPGAAHILEIAWGSLATEDIHSHLIKQPEGLVIPRRIQFITGIFEKHMTEAVALAEALTALQKFMTEHAGESPIAVIHFAQFERAFLADAFAQIQQELPFTILCTHEIAKRLFPNLPTRGIKGLAGYFGCPSGELKRATNHVQATQVIWQGLASALEEKGIKTFSELQNWLQETPKTARTKYEYPLPKEKRLGLPKEPGIYRMLSRWGEVLYVGKATSLHDRVNSYFRGQKNRDSKKLEMLTQVWDLQVTVVGSPLEAALLETDEIKRLDPPYNISLKTGRREMIFYNRDFTAANPTATDEFFLGPFSSAAALDSVLKLSQSLQSGIFAEDIFFELLDVELIREGFGIFCARHEFEPERFKSVREILAVGLRWYRDLEDAEEDTTEVEETLDLTEEELELTADDIADKFERHFIRSAAAYLRTKKLTYLLNAQIAIRSPLQSQFKTVQGKITSSDQADIYSKIPWQGLSIDTYDRMTVLKSELDKLLAKDYEIEISKV